MLKPKRVTGMRQLLALRDAMNASEAEGLTGVPDCKERLALQAGDFSVWSLGQVSALGV